MPEIYPLTGWQYHLIWRHEDKTTNRAFLDLMTLSYALWVKPGISTRRVIRAFQTLCQRHDVLRSRFHPIAGDWKCTIGEGKALRVDVHDHSTALEKDIGLITRRKGREFLDMEDEALVRLDLLRFGAHGDVVVFRVHHALTDGFGLAVIFEDMISLMLGLPLQQSAMSHAAYMNGWGGDTAPQSAAAEAYWEKTLLPPPRPLNIGRVKRGLPILKQGLSWDRSKTVTVRLGASEAAVVYAQAQEANVTSFMLANVAFLNALTTQCGAEETLYSVTLGRSDRRLSNYGGHHTLHPLMRYRRKRGASLADAAHEASTQLADVLANAPSPSFRESGLWDRKLEAAGAYPRQIMTGVLSARARINASPFAQVLSLSGGTSINVGGFELRDIPVPIDPGGNDELNFRPNFDETGGVVQFKYASDGFEDAEIDVLIDQTFQRLGVDPQNRHVLDAPPVD